MTEFTKFNFGCRPDPCDFGGSSESGADNA